MSISSVCSLIFFAILFLQSSTSGSATICIPYNWSGNLINFALTYYNFTGAIPGIVGCIYQELVGNTWVANSSSPLSFFFQTKLLPTALAYASQPWPLFLNTPYLYQSLTGIFFDPQGNYYNYAQAGINITKLYGRRRSGLDYYDLLQTGIPTSAPSSSGIPAPEVRSIDEVSDNGIVTATGFFNGVKLPFPKVFNLSDTVETPTLEPTSAPTSVPTSAIPTSVPTSAIPTSVPTSAIPTSVPTSAIPTSASPTSVPTSAIPTLVPSSAIPTLVPTSAIPTSVPTSAIPTSASPTSVIPQVLLNPPPPATGGFHTSFNSMSALHS